MSDLEVHAFHKQNTWNSHEVQVLGLTSTWVEDYVQASNAADKQLRSCTKTHEEN